MGEGEVGVEVYEVKDQLAAWREEEEEENGKKQAKGKEGGGRADGKKRFPVTPVTAGEAQEEKVAVELSGTRKVYGPRLTHNLPRVRSRGGGWWWWWWWWWWRGKKFDGVCGSTWWMAGRERGGGRGKEWQAEARCRWRRGLHPHPPLPSPWSPHCTLCPPPCSPPGSISRGAPAH